MILGLGGCLWSIGNNFEFHTQPTWASMQMYCYITCTWTCYKICAYLVFHSLHPPMTRHYHHLWYTGSGHHHSHRPHQWLGKISGLPPKNQSVKSKIIHNWYKLKNYYCFWLISTWPVQCTMTCRRSVNMLSSGYDKCQTSNFLIFSMDLI